MTYSKFAKIHSFITIFLLAVMVLSGFLGFTLPLLNDYVFALEAIGTDNQNFLPYFDYSIVSSILFYSDGEQGYYVFDLSDSDWVGFNLISVSSVDNTLILNNNFVKSTSVALTASNGYTSSYNEVINYYVVYSDTSDLGIKHEHILTFDFSLGVLSSDLFSSSLLYFSSGIVGIRTSFPEPSVYFYLSISDINNNVVAYLTLEIKTHFVSSQSSEPTDSVTAVVSSLFGILDDDGDTHLISLRFTPPNSSLFSQGSYDSGYSDGFSAGIASANSSVNENSSSYRAGYAAGASAANSYTFRGLIGAVLDVPVKTFVSLFDFDILGFNMLTFVSGLLALSAFIAVVRRLL